MIVAEGLVKTYKTRVKRGLLKSEIKMTEAVKGLDLEIEPGKIVGLLGINGAGKTTTIKMLSTLLEPDGGRGTVDGMDLAADSMKIKRIINMIAGGERMIYWRLTGRENLWYFGKLYNIEKDILNKRMDILLEFVGLSDVADQPVEQYSKGMKQRLQIARGLINDPKYIFMDEPTLGLDAPVARELRKYARQLVKNEGKAILLTSHYMNEVEELCDYIYIIDSGRKIMEGTPRDVTSLVTHSASKYRVRTEKLGSRLKENLSLFAARLETACTINEFEEGCEIEISSQHDIQGELISLLASDTKILNFEAVEPGLEDAIIRLSEERKDV